MELFHKDWPMLAPSVCFICEERPAPAVPVVDTLRTFEPGGPTQLTGRKYVCGQCIETMGKVLGLVSDEAFQELESELRVTRQKMKEMKGKIRLITEAAA